MDLRWQRADQKPGFYGIKDTIKLRSAEPNFKIDWEPFDSVDRNKKQAEYLEKVRLLEYYQTLQLLHPTSAN